MFSVIVPAHNEAAVIGQCLASLLDQAFEDELEIIVVCNACTDETAAIARSFGPLVRVIETSVPGKPNALNMGDKAARFFPRLYVDADVVITTASARKVIEVLREGEVHAASAQLRVNFEDRSWPLRAYYRIWTRLPYCREEMVGSGVYALSEQGRAAFGDFPELLAEDDFIRMTFPRVRRRQVEGASFLIEAPTTFLALLKIRSRWARSNDQIDAQYPHLRRNDQRDYRPVIRELVRQPGLWAAAAVYGLVVLTTRVVGKLQIRFASNPHNWSRDLTARRYVGARAAAPGPAEADDPAERTG